MHLIEDTNPEVTSHFTDGVYCRVLDIPASYFLIGKKHLTNHMNVLLEGTMLLAIGSEIKVIRAPYVFEALKDSVKIGLTFDRCKFMNIHPTDSRNIEEIEKEFTQQVNYEDKETEELKMAMVKEAKKLIGGV